MTFIRKLPTLEPEMRGALRNHIIRKRQRLKQELEQEAIEKRLKRERELKRVQDAMTLDQIKEQLSSLEKKLEVLRDEKRHLFVQLKQLLSEDNNRRKQLDDSQPTAVTTATINSTYSTTTTTTTALQYQCKVNDDTYQKLPGNNQKQEVVSPCIRPPMVAPMTESTFNLANQRPRLPPTSLTCASDANIVLRQQQQQAINHITSQHQQLFPQQMIRHPSLSDHQPRTSTYHFAPNSIPNSIPSPLTISTSYPDLPSYLRSQQSNSNIGPLSGNVSQFQSFSDYRPPPPHPFLHNNQLEFALQHQLATAQGHKPIPQMDTPISLTTSSTGLTFDPNQMLSGKRSFSDANLIGDSFDARGMGRKKPPPTNFPYPPTGRFQIDSLPPGLPNLAQLGLLNHMPTPTSGIPPIRPPPPPAFNDHQPIPISSAQSSVMNVPRSLHASGLNLNYDFTHVSPANTPKQGLMLPGLNPYHLNNQPTHPLPPHSHQPHLLPTAPQIPHALYGANLDLKNYPFHNLPPHLAARFGLPPLHDQNSRYIATPNLTSHHKKLHKKSPK